MLSNPEMLLRLALAAALGSVVGVERERLQWTAGLRTHMLVCVGSALFALVSAFGFSDVLGLAHVVLDPSRVAAQVVSGIGFLGAALIFAILAGLKPLERRFWSSRGGSEITLIVERDVASLAVVQSAIRTVTIEPGAVGDEDEITVGVHRQPAQQMVTTLERLRQTKGVRSASMRS